MVIQEEDERRERKALNNYLKILLSCKFQNISLAGAALGFLVTFH